MQEEDLWVLTMGCLDLDGGYTGTDKASVGYTPKVYMLYGSMHPVLC